MGIVRHKLDVDGRPRRYDGRGGDVAAVLPEQVSRIRVPVVDLDVIVPTEDVKILKCRSATFVVMCEGAEIKSEKKKLFTHLRSL